MDNTALISIQDKKGLLILCKIFKKFNIKIISTDGTFKEITEMGFISKKII